MKLFFCFFFFWLRTARILWGSSSWASKGSLNPEAFFSFALLSFKIWNFFFVFQPPQQEHATQLHERRINRNSNPLFGHMNMVLFGNDLEKLQNQIFGRVSILIHRLCFLTTKIMFYQFSFSDVEPPTNQRKNVKYDTSFSSLDTRFERKSLVCFLLRLKKNKFFRFSWQSTKSIIQRFCTRTFWLVVQYSARKHRPATTSRWCKPQFLSLTVLIVFYYVQMSDNCSDWTVSTTRALKFETKKEKSTSRTSFGHVNTFNVDNFWSRQDTGNAFIDKIGDKQPTNPQIQKFFVSNFEFVDRKRQVLEMLIKILVRDVCPDTCKFFFAFLKFFF